MLNQLSMKQGDVNVNTDVFGSATGLWPDYGLRDEA